MLNIDLHPCQPSSDIECFIAIAEQFLPILGVINALSSPLEKYWGGMDPPRDVRP